MNNIGFTGTRKGMTKKQRESFQKLIESFKIKEFHHGDCIGADKESHDIIKKLDPKPKIMGHPPKYSKYRAFCKADIWLKPKDYLTRNKDIVDSTDILIGITAGKEKLMSGTWSTIRYARKKDKPIYIISPDGKLKVENIEQEIK